MLLNKLSHQYQETAKLYTGRNIPIGGVIDSYFGPSY